MICLNVQAPNGIQVTKTGAVTEPWSKAAIVLYMWSRSPWWLPRAPGVCVFVLRHLRSVGGSQVVRRNVTPPYRPGRRQGACGLCKQVTQGIENRASILIWIYISHSQSKLSKFMLSLHFNLHSRLSVFYQLNALVCLKKIPLIYA